MSLTSRLRDAESPVREYLDQVSPRLHATSGIGAGARAAKESLGLIDLVNSAPMVVPFPGTDRALIGTSIDFRARIELGGFDPQHSAAAAGAALLPELATSLENGHHRARILTEAFAVAETLLQTSDDRNLDKAAVLLAYCEQVFRAGTKTLTGSVGRDCDNAVDGAEFAEQIDPLTLADVRSLMLANTAQLDTWRSRIAAGERFDQNPAFTGSSLVDGADADWLIGETLIDSKVYAAPTMSSLRSALRQLLGYVMLDLEDDLRIRRVGIWLPRQRLMPTWSLTRLLGGDPDALLPLLRQGFISAAANNQLAKVSPIPIERLHKRLADNRHTPYDMMAELALSDDTEVRRRIARNPITPEATIRILARDPRWEVREGVAMNESVAYDVLDSLAHDRSVVVRRAVAANPGMPQRLKKLHPAYPASSIQRVANTAVGALNESAASIDIVQEATEDPDTPASSRPRDGLVVDPTWFSAFLTFTQTKSNRIFDLPIPEASLKWAYIATRMLTIPKWMRAGLPAEVLADLLRPEQQSWVRRWVARQLPIADLAFRERLLDDADANIRWTTLKRTIHLSDHSLRDRLEELASSAEARLRFRTAGLGPRRDWPRPAGDYHHETLCLIASHPSTPDSALTALSLLKPSPELWANLIENPSFPAASRMALVESMGASKSAAVRQLLASLRGISESVLLALASDKDVQVRVTVAANESAPPALLARLGADVERTVRLSALENPAAPDETVRIIAHAMLLDDEGYELQQLLRLTEKRADLVPTESIQVALDRLSKSRLRDPDLRVVAAHDRRCGGKTLTRLARSSDNEVRSAVAGNQTTPTDVLEQLANDPDHEVRAAAAFNPKCPPAALVALATDDFSTVRSRAAEHPDLARKNLDALLVDHDPKVRNAAMRNPGTPADVRLESERTARESSHDRSQLEKMVASTRADVRIQVAFDPAAGPDLLAMLGGERRGVRVHRAVAANPNTPAAVLRSLATINDSQVLQALAFNGSTPPDLLRELATRSVDLAVLVVMNPDAGGVIDDLAGDDSPLVRFAANGAKWEMHAAGNKASSPAIAVVDGDREEPASK